MNVHGIIFDKDGTLFDFATTWENWAKSFLMRACDGNHDRARAAGARIGFDLDVRRFTPDSVVIAGTPAEVAEALSPLFPGYSPKAMLDLLNDEAAAAPQQQTVPLVPFLTGLRARGLTTGVATNDAEAPARAHLDGAGVTHLFDFIAGFDSGHGSKPAPGQLLAFAAHTGLEPRAIAMVGDSPHDMNAARAAGMIPVAVLTGMARRDVLAPLAHVVLDSIGALPAWLEDTGHLSHA